MASSRPVATSKIQRGIRKVPRKNNNAATRAASSRSDRQRQDYLFGVDASDGLRVFVELVSLSAESSGQRELNGCSFLTIRIAYRNTEKINDRSMTIAAHLSIDQPYLVNYLP
jgi:hypothetical protein